MPADSSARQRVLFGASLIVVIAFVVSGIHPFDRLTWGLEVFPVVIVAPVLFATRRRFPLTTLLFVLIACHALVLIMGGAYTYARVPVGFWLQDLFSLSRNPYDRIGHLMQGLVPALAAREILLRGAYVRGRRMAGFLSICVALSVSLIYELIEWWSALAWGQGANEFLGTQGDEWDTQWDMFMALVGALFAICCVGRMHDRQIASVEGMHVHERG